MELGAPAFLPRLDFLCPGHNKQQLLALFGFVEPWTFSTGSGRKEGSGSDGEGRESLFFGNVAKPSIGKHPSLAALNKPTWAWVSLIYQLTPTQRL